MSLPYGNFFTDFRVQRNHMSGHFDVVMTRMVGGKEFGVQFQQAAHETPLGAMGVTHMLTEKEAQLMLDALLDAGVKPTAKISVEKSETFNAGKVEGMTAHLEDMRRLVFGQDRDLLEMAAMSPDTPLTRASEI